MTVFEDRAFREVKFNEIIRVEPEFHMTGVLTRRVRNKIDFSLYSQRIGHVRTQRKWPSASQQEREVSLETDPNGTLILDL